MILYPGEDFKCDDDIDRLVEALSNDDLLRLSKDQSSLPHYRPHALRIRMANEILSLRKATTERDASIANDIRFALEQLAGVIATQYAPSKRLIAAMDALERAVKTIEA